MKREEKIHINNLFVISPSIVQKSEDVDLNRHKMAPKRAIITISWAFCEHMGVKFTDFGSLLLPFTSL
jgi:hypothetical protein